MAEPSYKHVCVKCRKVARSRRYGPMCPSCGGEMHCMGSDFKTPKAKDDKGWMRIAKIIRARSYTAEEHKMLSREGLFTPEDTALRKSSRPWWQRFNHRCARGL